MNGSTVAGASRETVPLRVLFDLRVQVVGFLERVETCFCENWSDIGDLHKVGLPVSDRPKLDAVQAGEARGLFDHLLGCGTEQCAIFGFTPA